MRKGDKIVRVTVTLDPQTADILRNLADTKHGTNQSLAVRSVLLEAQRAGLLQPSTQTTQRQAAA